MMLWLSDILNCINKLCKKIYFSLLAHFTRFSKISWMWRTFKRWVILDLQWKISILMSVHHLLCSKWWCFIKYYKVKYCKPCHESNLQNTCKTVIFRFFFLLKKSKHKNNDFSCFQPTCRVSFFSFYQ